MSSISPYDGVLLGGVSKRSSFRPTNYFFIGINLTFQQFRSPRFARDDRKRQRRNSIGGVRKTGAFRPTTNYESMFVVVNN